MPPVGFEPAISAGEQTYAFDLAATGTGSQRITKAKLPPEFPILNNTVVLSPFSFRVDDTGFVAARCKRSSDRRDF